MYVVLHNFREEAMFTYHILLLLVTYSLAATIVTFEEANETDSIQDLRDLADDTADDDYGDYINTLWQASPRELKDSLIYDQRYTYIINNEHVCEKNVFVLALVKSTPERFKERQAVRSTWASLKSHDDKNIVTLFVMGTYKSANGSVVLENELRNENSKSGDIIQGDFIEHKRNQTYKSIMGLSWAKEFCGKAQFVLNTNDDTMVDIFHLIDFLTNQQQGKPDGLLYCSTFFDYGPVRNPADEFFVTRNEYPYDKFPPYCEDFAYILSNDVMLRLLEATKDVPFFWRDNVYVTGMLAAKAEVKHTDMAERHGYNLMQPEHLMNDIENSMFLLAKYRSLRKDWDNAWKIIQSR